MNKQPKIGLVLGGGGAKGLASIGVLNVLLSKKIPIHCVAGTSIGSLIGAYYAINLEVKTLEDLVNKMNKKDFIKLIDLTSPKKSLIGGRKIKRFLKKIINKKYFSDTKIPLTIVATDLRTGKEIRLKKGKLIDAIMASISIPGIFPPYKINDRLLVDGGISNPTPIDVIDEMGADIIIAVDFTLPEKIKLRSPTIIDTVMRSFEILRGQTAKLRMLEVKRDFILIKPKLSTESKFIRYDLAKDFMKQGELAAKKILPKIQKALNKYFENKKK